MNIFMTDPCPQISAYNLCDKHVNKMIIECAQMLSTTHRLYDNDYADKMCMYKSTHVNYVPTIWCRESLENYNWVYAHMIYLGEMYELKSGKVHKTIRILAEALKDAPPSIVSKGLTQMAPTMPDEIKVLDMNLYDKYKICLIEKYKEWVSRKVKPQKVEFVLARPDWLV